MTDANLVLGRLDPDYFLGRTYSLDLRSAEQALGLLLKRSGSLFKSTLELAQGIVAVTNANMERALRVISVERGHDPRDFTLVCFGGAGGLHAAELARATGIKQVIVPPSPGAFSALGILISDIVKDVSVSVLLPVPDERKKRGTRFPGFYAKLSRQLARLEAEGRAQLKREGFSSEREEADWRLDVRALGQAYELTVPFAADFPARFHCEHEKAYGYAHRGRPLEVVNLRVRLTIPTPKPRFRPRAATRGTPRVALAKKKPVWFGARFWESSFYDRDRLGVGMEIRGPAIIVEYSSTTVVPPDWKCEVDKYLNLVLTGIKSKSGASISH